MAGDVGDVDPEAADVVDVDPDTIDAGRLDAVDGDGGLDGQGGVDAHDATEVDADDVDEGVEGVAADEAGEADEADEEHVSEPVTAADAEGPAHVGAGPGSLAAALAADETRVISPRRTGAPPVPDLRDIDDRPAATRAPLVVAVPPPRRRKRLIATAVLLSAAAVGVGVAFGSRSGSDAGDASSVPTTTPEVLAATAAPTVASSTATTAAAPTTTAPAPTTAAPPATTAAAAPATTTAVPTTVAPPAAAASSAGTEELPNLFTPVRWAVFQGGRVELLGRVPSQAVADTIATKAAAVVGPGNVDVKYIIDPTAPLPPSAPLYVRDTIQFGPGSAVVAPQFKPLLGLGVTLMKQNPGVKIWVIGRADSQGDPTANLYLSLDRSQAVIDYIVATGIDPGRLITVPLGTDGALGDNATVEGRQQNRSVEFVISGLLN